MHSVPSNDLLLNKRPHVSSFYGGSSSHRLKHLQKSDRRVIPVVDGSIFSCNTSHYPDISSSGGSSTDPHNLIQNNSKDLSMTDLKTCLTELLSIEDTGISTSAFILSPGKNDTQVCYISASREPKSSVAVFMGEKEKHEKDITAEGSTKHSSQCYSRSISLPPEKEMQEAWVPLKLVSALKGSREKQGTPPKKLSVTWALTFLRGSRGKDTKQGRKSGGSNKLKPFHEENGVGLVDPHVGTVDYNVGTRDPFCGSSFLKESVTKLHLHFPVAEAT
ncbi:hypothetical protein DH2020_026169 [Rehmannia glutinosa]|uniref:Uncharacterized protein n=1 Tax=Rehmannia glutinosa TaxID=99300 RepID=A0ABR0W0T8_REHGL